MWPSCAWGIWKHCKFILHFLPCQFFYPNWILDFLVMTNKRFIEKKQFYSARFFCVLNAMPSFKTWGREITNFLFLLDSCFVRVRVCHDYLNSNFLQARHVDIPYLPMLVPPKKWKGYVGVHALDLSSKFLVTSEQLMIWLISRTYRILSLVIWTTSTIYYCSYDKGGHLFLPSYIMRTHGVKDQKDAIKSAPRKQLRKVFEVC